MVSCGTVVPTSGTFTSDFFTSLIAFLTAPGTSLAFTVPKPTWPFLSPITTTAANLKWRPPYVTFVTWLIVTTVPENSLSAWLRLNPLSWLNQDLIVCSDLTVFWELKFFSFLFGSLFFLFFHKKTKTKKDKEYHVEK